MGKDDYIRNYISDYINCVRASTGISPEISASDYIMLRKQALLEYPQQTYLTEKPPDAQEKDRYMPPPKQAVQPMQERITAHPEADTGQIQEEERNNPAALTAEEEELAILQSLKED